MPKKLEIRHKWVGERLDSMIYGDNRQTGPEVDALRDAFEFLEENEAAAGALIDVTVALCQEHVTEAEKRERRARKAYQTLRRGIGKVLKDAADTVRVRD